MSIGVPVAACMRVPPAVRPPKRMPESTVLAFDVEAVHDQVVQSQLATLNKDERSREAINLLVYNTYMGPGQVQTLKGGALNSILESELNQWTRKYFNTGLTFGIDTYDQY